MRQPLGEPKVLAAWELNLLSEESSRRLDDFLSARESLRRRIRDFKRSHTAREQLRMAAVLFMEAHRAHLLAVEEFARAVKSRLASLPACALED